MATTTPSSSSATAATISQGWLQAIQAATQSLHYNNPQQDNDLAKSYEALEALQKQLLQEKKFHMPPRRLPTSSPAMQQQQPLLIPSQVRGTGGVDLAAVIQQGKRSNSSNNNNRFASLMGDDEEDDDEQQMDEDQDEEDEETVPPTTNPNALSTLRLLIRIETALCDVAQSMARQCIMMQHQDDTIITRGVAILQDQALPWLHQALVRADEEICKSLYNDETNDNSYLLLLQQDADICHVALQAMIATRQTATTKLQRAAQKLQRALQPQWQSRDKVKERWGQDRWTNNPHPKQDYAKVRATQEQQLKKLEQAVQALQDSEGLVQNMSSTTVQWKGSLVDVANDANNAHHAQRRYNGLRPEDQPEWFAHDRLTSYSDATTFGWTFTGSHAPSQVEFFEKNFTFEDDTTTLVKLDFYYSTGTVKTSLFHPGKRRPTQLFLSGTHMTPLLYIQILENPRVHTQQLRYQTVAHKTPAGEKKKKKNGRSKNKNGRRRSNGRTSD